MSNIPEEYQDLLAEDNKAFAELATVMDDGTPQVTPVWFDWDGHYVIINTARGRIKAHNMETRPNVALVIVDPKNPYRYLQIRGRVADFTEKGAWENINKLSFKYNGKPYPQNPGEVRVMFKILPEKIHSYR